MKLNESLRRKFLKTYNIPYTITTEPHFSNAINVLGYNKQLYDFVNYIYDFNTVEEMYNYTDKIFGNKNSNGILIDSIKEHTKYITIFEEFEFYNTFYGININNLNKISNLYSNTNVNSVYISIDIKEANYQIFKMFDIVKDDTYYDFVGKYTKYEHLKNNKQLRQVIFGKLNPKRQQLYQRYVMKKLYDLLGEHLECEIYYYTSDELIVKINTYNNTSIQSVINILNKHESLLDNVKTLIAKNKEVLNNVNFKVDMFYLNVLKTKSGFYYYKQYKNKPNKSKSTSKNEYLEVYKLINNIEVINLDLVTMINTGNTKRIAKLEPLQIIK